MAVQLQASSSRVTTGDSLGLGHIATPPQGIRSVPGSNGRDYRPGDREFCGGVMNKHSQKWTQPYCTHQWCVRQFSEPPVCLEGTNASLEGRLRGSILSMPVEDRRSAPLPIYYHACGVKDVLPRRDPFPNCFLQNSRLELQNVSPRWSDGRTPRQWIGCPNDW